MSIVSDAEFVAEITDFVLSRKTYVWGYPCQNDCSAIHKFGASYQNEITAIASFGETSPR